MRPTQALYIFQRVYAEYFDMKCGVKAHVSLKISHVCHMGCNEKVRYPESRGPMTRDQKQST